MLTYVAAFISPLLPPSCRFLPTCSVYSMQAIREYGPAKGAVLTAWRLVRCNPIHWSNGGRFVPSCLLVALVSSKVPKERIHLVDNSGLFFLCNTHCPLDIPSTIPCMVHTCACTNRRCKQCKHTLHSCRHDKYTHVDVHIQTKFAPKYEILTSSG
jgi:putative membrane protein insertion efficiency factor